MSRFLLSLQKWLLQFSNVGTCFPRPADALHHPDSARPVRSGPGDAMNSPHPSHSPLYVSWALFLQCYISCNLCPSFLYSSSSTSILLIDDLLNCFQEPLEIFFCLKKKNHCRLGELEAGREVDGYALSPFSPMAVESTLPCGHAVITQGSSHCVEIVANFS